MKPVRWGVIGVSNHFLKRVLPPVKISEAIELYGIASRGIGKARKTAEKYGMGKYYGSYDALIDDPEIEAIYIPLPNHMHLEWVKKAADAGKHILCEKPMTMNAVDTREVVDYVSGKGVLLMEAFMYRFQPRWIRARELVLSGHIGKVTTVHTSFGYTNTDPSNIRNRLETGGGALYDIGCYAVSVARWMFDSEPIRAIGQLSRDRVFHTDTLTSGLLDFGGGRATFSVWTQSFPFQRVDIIGGNGRIHINMPFNTPPDTASSLSVVTVDGADEIVFEPSDQYGLQFEHFSEAVRLGEPAPLPPVQAQNNALALDALFRSEKSGDWEIVSESV